VPIRGAEGKALRASSAALRPSGCLRRRGWAGSSFMAGSRKKMGLPPEKVATTPWEVRQLGTCAPFLLFGAASRLPAAPQRTPAAARRAQGVCHMKK